MGFDRIIALLLQALADLGGAGAFAGASEFERPFERAKWLVHGLPYARTFNRILVVSAPRFFAVGDALLGDIRAHVRLAVRLADQGVHLRGRVPIELPRRPLDCARRRFGSVGFSAGAKRAGGGEKDYRPHHSRHMGSHAGRQTPSAKISPSKIGSDNSRTHVNGRLMPSLFLALILASAQAPATGTVDDGDWQPDSREASLMGNDDEAVTKGFTRVRKTIPTTFQGVFRKTLAECGQASDSALTVRPTKMHFSTSEADVQRVRIDGSRKIVVTSIYDGNGQVWEKTETILLGKGGHSIAIQSEQGPDTRLRCPR